MAGLVIKPRSRIYHGHDWVYSTEVLKSFGNPRDGEVVSLKDGNDRLLGSAIFNGKSQIVARRFSRQRQELDRDFFDRRLKLAIEYRQRRGLDPRLCRLVWSESDGLPGLIVDRYGDHVVMQTLTLAMDQRKAIIAESLTGLLQPRGIVERNDAPIRKAEGMELNVGMLAGEEPGLVQIESLGLKFEVDLLRGHKTGFYLDQVQNYASVAAQARGRKVLDCFSNQGAFALACAQAGAASVQAVEISADATAQIRGNAERNGLRVEAIEANAFDFLRAQEQAEAHWDLIILDPPSFTRTKGKLHDALRGYKEVHLRALKLLNPDGLLATFCCSHHVSKSDFSEIINDASVDARKTVRQLAVYSQSLDHPIIPTIPETEYLKGGLFELVPGR
jgi:23S rRNA (cytosine1962-C5)-methyltransferase